MEFSFMDELHALEREKGVPAETILEALANALVSAYKRTPGAAQEARVTIDPDTGEITVYGQELDDDENVVDEWEDTPSDFGRIAAQTAKQVIVQRLRDAKRAQVYEIYQGREGDLVTGIVQQSDHRYVILDLGNAEAVMPSSERIPYERLDRGARVKALIIEVRGDKTEEEEAEAAEEEGRRRRSSGGPQIVASRSHPDFIRRLFELEVPELVDGVVEIKAIARDAGHRTKIAVASNDHNVDPVGACVGARGARVRQVVNELRGEKVDIVEWRDSTEQFIAEALSPARVRQVILDEEEMQAIVVVPDHQLSLAIGKEGQNARLAARLSGYRIDIRSETEHEHGPGGEEQDAEGEAAEGAAAAEAGAAEAVTPVEEPSGEGETVEDAVEEASGDETAVSEEAAESDESDGSDEPAEAPEPGETPAAGEDAEDQDDEEKATGEEG
ncbi:MAG: transcription termination factor NusA [Deltaproteobacteria bacterium]|nr:transcription termination factor NusA [Deltaproteobacteria bacterium]